MALIFPFLTQKQVGLAILIKLREENRQPSEQIT